MYVASEDGNPGRLRLTLGIVLTAALLVACSGDKNEVTERPRPAATEVSPGTTGPVFATTALPGDIVAGTPPERWGDFLLAQDAKTLDRRVERPAPATLSGIREGAGLLDYLTPHLTDEAKARADRRLPLLGSLPAGEEFFAANVREEPGQGAVEGFAAYIRPELRTIQLSQFVRPAMPGGDETILVFWSRLHGAPLGITPLRELPGRRIAYLQRTEKVRVRGNPGVIRLYASRDGGDPYVTRNASVLIHWFEGDVLWIFASYFLTPDEALRTAESIRPVSTP
jgi:hypothetical protein